jgi:nifR3 family TIM-barrel protein
MKTRIGIDSAHQTYLDAGKIAEESGAAAIGLHGRTAAQAYSGQADWTKIAALVEHVSIPVLGNGDIWEASDALRMVAETGCAGVIVGRGCLGRPWLFRDLADAFAGRPVADPPLLGAVADVLVQHLDLLASRMGPERALRDIRKHVSWYLTGYPVGAELRRTLTTTGSIEQFRDALHRADRGLPLPPAHWDGPRGTQRGPQKVTLPDRWLENREASDAPGALADALTSGG